MAGTEGFIDFQLRIGGIDRWMNEAATNKTNTVEDRYRTEQILQYKLDSF